MAEETKRQPPQRETGVGEVIEVLSGDTIVVSGYSRKNSEPPRKTLTLAGVNAPKFARGAIVSEDEPFAWQSREWLRKKVIGQRVAFVITYKGDGKGRQYADVTFNGQSLAQEIVRAGWAATQKNSKGKGEKNEKNERPQQPERAVLYDLEQQAAQAGKGIHNTAVDKQDNVRQIERRVDSFEFFKRHKLVPLPAIVDRVQDGSSVRVEIPAADGTLNHNIITVYLAGVCSPSFPPRQNEEKQDKRPVVPRFANEARRFVERRLLNQDVSVLLQAIDKAGYFIGTILFPRGNIAIRLLENGLAKFVPWSAQLTNDAQSYKLAEERAQKQKLRIWETEAPPAIEPSIAGQVFSTKVLEVLSGDTLSVRPPSGEGSLKLFFASIRTPRLAGGRPGQDDEPCSFEAREFVRRKLFEALPGQIRFQGEYSKDKRDYVTVWVGNENLSEALLRAGLATVLRHKIDEPRSLYYSSFVDFENTAKTNGLKIHDKQAQSKYKVSDLTRRSSSKKENGEKDPHKKLLATLGKKPVVGTTEFVFSPTRLKLYLDSQRALISLSLKGVKPATVPVAKKQVDGEGEEQEAKVEAKQQAPDPALTFLREFTKGKTLTVEIESVDERFKNFVGVAKTSNGELLNAILVREGLLKVDTYDLDRWGNKQYKSELEAAEQMAKNGNKGIWINYDPVKEAQAKADKEAAAKLRAEAAAKVREERREAAREERKAARGTRLAEGSEIKVKVTEITDAVTFYVQQTAGSPNADTIEKAMAEYVRPDEDVQMYEGLICAGIFSEQWHRVKLLNRTELGWNALFIDYGNSDILTAEYVGVLDESLQKLAPLATPCVLAGLKAPGVESEWGESAMIYFNELAWDKELTAKFKARDNRDRWHLVLDIEGEDKSVNEQLVEQGWARIQSRPPRSLVEYVKTLKPSEEIAQRNHLNIWEYGNVSSGEEDNNDGRQRNDGRPPAKKR